MKTIYKKTLSGTLGLLTAASLCTALPALNASAALLLEAEFETTNDSFTGRYGAKAGWTSERAYTGNCSLLVTNRQSTWQGAERSVDSLMRAGETYAISAAVLQENAPDAEMKLTLQFTNTAGETDYSEIALKTALKGEWTVLSNAEYTVPAGATNLVLYMETTDSLTDFYLDTVTVDGKPAQIKKGDANGDLNVNIADAVALARFLSADLAKIEEGADFDENGKINAVDLTLLKQYLTRPKSNLVSGDWDNYDEKLSESMLKVYQDGLYRVGNTARIREKIAAAQRGENIKIGYIGGSITGGGSSTSESKRFVNLSYQYFADTFGTGRNVSFVNAGLAGTSSVVGNMRVDKDILSKNCDIIFIEFAVNDQGAPRFQKSYESLVKKCLMQPNAPAVVLITLCQKSGNSCQDWMAKIGEYYDLPVISGKDAVMNGIASGTLNWDSDYGSGDTTHPGDRGHQLIANLIGYYYRQALRSANANDDYEIPTGGVYGSEYATAEVVNFNSLSGFTAGSWTKGTANPEHSDGYTYSKNGNDPMKFSVEGKGILLMFQSNDVDTMGTVLVTVNGKTQKVTGKLPWTWGGFDGDVGYYQEESGKLDVSIEMETPGKSFVIYEIAVIK